MSFIIWSCSNFRKKGSWQSNSCCYDSAQLEVSSKHVLRHLNALSEWIGSCPYFDCFPGTFSALASTLHCQSFFYFIFPGSVGWVVSWNSDCCDLAIYLGLSLSILCVTWSLPLSAWSRWISYFHEYGLQPRRAS